MLQIGANLLYFAVVNYQTAAKELVRALRGKRSQTACNRRLRHSSNALHTWETGTRFPTASDFLKLAKLARIDTEAALARFVSHSAHVEQPLTSRAGFASWLEALAEGRSISELSRGLGRTRNTVARWLEAKTEPRLPDLLAYLELTQKQGLQFVAAFVDPMQLPSVRSAYRDLELQRNLAYGMPWANAVLRALELRAYRRLGEHRPGVISELIGVDLQVEEACLAALSQAGQIRKLRGKWHLANILSVDTRADPESNLKVKRHWASVAQQRLQGDALPKDSLFSYNVFAVSDEGLARIKSLHLGYYERLRAVVAESHHPTRVVLANVQLCPLGEEACAG